MSVRPVVATALALGTGFAPPPRPLPPRSTVTTRYHVETKVQTAIDLSTFGQPSQEFSVGVSAWIAVSLSDTAGGRILNAVVDSVKVEGTTPQLSQATADSAKGGSVHGFVNAQDRVKDLATSPPNNIVLTDVQGLLQGLFPRFHPGAKPGDGWSDTVEVTSTSGGANIKTRSLVEYTAVGPESVAGMPATKLTTKSTITITGTQEDPRAGTIEVEGTGASTGTHFIGADGRYLGGSWGGSMTQSLKMAMAPAPIPMKVSRLVTVTVIP